MYFDSLHALLLMEGHGVYVWTAYLVTTLCMALAILAPVRRSRRLLVQFERELKPVQGSTGSGQLSKGAR